MEIQFLGTGAGMPTKMRNTSAIVLNLRAEGEGYWLFDCGEATQHQLQYTSIKPGKIDRVFITHLHGDHLFGLPGFLSSRSFLGGDTPLTIYGPKGIRQWIHETLRLTETHLTYPLFVKEIEKEGKLDTVGDFTIYTKKLDHVIDSFGFRIEQKEQLGALLPEKVLAAGVPKGPLFRELKEGRDIVLEDGTIVYSKDVTAAPERGFIVAICGDTRMTPASIDLAKSADILVHEATFEEGTEDLAKTYGHSTIQEAAIVAKKANVQYLIATHISARFQREDLPKLRSSGQKIFSPLYIAHDFARYVWQQQQLHYYKK